MELIDMHIHTTSSDGILTPSEVVEWAVNLGLKGIAITDHDTIDGIPEAIEKASLNSEIQIIPGIEFSTIFKDKEVHILGYFLDYNNEELLSITNKIKEHRATRAQKMVQRLKKINIHIDERVIIDNDGSSIGRPHIARALVKKGYVGSIQQAFERYLNRGMPGFVDRFKISIDEAIEIIRAAKGIPVLAHPGLLHKSLNIYEILKMGILGMEVYHTKHTEDETKYFLSIAEDKELIITGGTDFHDQFIDGVPAIGSIGVDFESIKGYIKNT